MKNKNTTGKSFRLIYKVTLLSMMSAIIATHTFGQNSMEGDEKMMKKEGTDLMYKAPESPEDISPLLTGETIPMITLKDVSGKDFELHQAVATKPTILVFYRGGWCPYCSKQLAALQELMPELEKMGYQLIAISTDSPEGLQASATEKHLGYTLLSDANLNASKRFGLAFKAPKAYWEMLPETTGGMDQELLLPVPSVFILDKSGKIHYEYINPDFKQRLSTELLKAVTQTLYKEL
ncbi:peroxiredoxin-like family protein [Olivibacter jilunii]|uniref:peroxiredoxin-like family protein n=1 Tax=Olivibacter jilunii TaxID=985016 RepID=UPI003F151EA1